ncbi:MAG: DinB family protein [Dehalococcoidia bacterium]
MARTQTESLLVAIAEARTAFLATLAAVDRGWDHAPAEDAWSPRVIARHVVENDFFFAAQVASVLDRPAPEEATVTFDSAGAAVDALHAARAATSSVFDVVRDEDLGRPWQHGMSLADLLAFYAEHTREHVEQLRAARAPMTLAS